MNPLRTAFFGTSDRSIPILESLKNNPNIDLVLCITKNDTKVGRHQELRETEVKKWAKANHVMVSTISSLKGMELEALIEQLKSSNVEYGVIADFSFIVPYPLIEHFDNKLINLHFSLLPLYRGASPVQFAILNGDDMTGVSYYLVDKRMDGGKIIHQIGYKMSGKETSAQLWSILFDLAASNLPKVLIDYSENQLKPRTQNEEEATYTYSPSHPKNTFIYKEDAQLNWKLGTTEIDRAIRAYFPWPIAWTTIEELESNKKLWEPKLALRKGIDKSMKLKIYSADLTTDQKLELKELQIEGKNKVDWKTFENGYIEKKS